MISKCPYCSHERFVSKTFEARVGNATYKMTYETEIAGRSEDELNKEAAIAWEDFKTMRSLK